MFDVVTIGSITRDNFLESDFNLIPWPRVSSGKAIVFPVGEKMSVRRVYSTIGGNSANARWVNIAPGDMRFVDVQMLPGQYVCSIRESDPGTGRAGVLSGGRALQGQ